MSMEDEKKDVVEVKAEEKTASNEAPKQENDPDHDHHQAIHGFGVAQHWLFIPGIVLSAASLTLLVIFAIWQSIASQNNWDSNLINFFNAMEKLNSYFFGLFIQALIGGIVFRCLLHHFKSDDPNWKDKADDYNAY
jgi:phosphotransferase system  glucose/maltose/N-acetylglucosamine-specific IIC component